MAGLFRKIAKGALIAGGTVLSLLNPAIGAPLVVAGQNIDTGKSVDKLSGYAANIETARSTVIGMQAGAAGADIWGRVKSNPVPYIAGAVGVLFLLKFLKIIK